MRTLMASHVGLDSQVKVEVKVEVKVRELGEGARESRVGPVVLAWLGMWLAR